MMFVLQYFQGGVSPGKLVILEGRGQNSVRHLLLQVLHLEFYVLKYNFKKYIHFTIKIFLTPTDNAKYSILPNTVC